MFYHVKIACYHCSFLSLNHAHGGDLFVPIFFTIKRHETETREGRGEERGEMREEKGVRREERGERREERD